jgi:hypothetical protein
MMNTKRDRKNLYVNLVKKDYMQKLQPLLRRGWSLRPSDGVYVPANSTIYPYPPWIYTQQYDGLRCGVNQQVYWDILKYIPSQCRNCWKVVVRPQTLEHLFNLYEYQRESGIPCKCGMEKRETVYGLYGGYFYNQGKEEGLERYKEVREAVDEYLSPETPVILKRYCTEYEIGGTPSDETPECTKEELDMERDISYLVPPSGPGTNQPDHQVINVMRRWIHYAYSNGDETYKLFTDDSPLFKPYVTYHEEEEKEK